MGGVPKRVRKGSLSWLQQFLFADKKEAVRQIRKYVAPPNGALRAMRHKRGLTIMQVADRMGITSNGVYMAERREAEGGISLGHLRRVAQALDCKLVYALIPEEELDQVLSGSPKTDNPRGGG